MAGRGAWRFIGVGLFVSGWGAGCGTSTLERPAREPPEQLQEADAGPLDSGPVTGEDTAVPPPGEARPQADAGPPPQPSDAGTLPDKPAPDACEGVPRISPRALAESLEWSDIGDKRISCITSVPSGAGGALVLRGDGATFEINSPGGTLARYLANTFLATSQPGGMLGLSEPLNDDPHWLTFVNAATGAVIQHSNEQARVVLTAAEPQGGLRTLLEEGTLKAYGTTGEARWSRSVSLSAPVSVLGVDARGQTLLLAVGDTRYGPSTVEGLWVDSSGQPGPSFLALAPAPEGRYELLPQAQAGLFLTVHRAGQKTWAAAFESLRPEGGPAPAWLARGAERPLLRLPGGKGYLRPSSDPASGSTCERQAELLAPTGSACGTLHFPPPVEAGHLCEPLKLGADGTLVEPLGARYVHPRRDEGPDGPSVQPGVYCMVRWWPRLLE